MEGICQELHEKYNIMGANRSKMIGSGNVIRKNFFFRQMVEKTFNIPLNIPYFSEEACIGAALCAVKGLGIKETFAKASSMLKYL